MPTFSVVTLAPITTVTVEGEVDYAFSRDLVQSLVEDRPVAGTNILLDIRGIRSGLTFPEVYRVVRALMDHPKVFSGRIALLDYYDDQFEKAQFFEASAMEAGIQAHAFLDEDKAIAWLNAAA